MAGEVTASEGLDGLRVVLSRLSAGLDSLATFVTQHYPEVPALREHEWHGLLANKLLPQLLGEPRVICAVMGGTNIGKTTLFNHLAGEHANEVSAQACYTKHPVLLAPQSLFGAANEGAASALASLTSLFPGFAVQHWASPEQSQADVAEDLLLVRPSATLDEHLLLLDTPDVDGEVEVNWRRAEAIRQAADVVLVVLTQQKYNDAAIKRFFREAAAEDKSTIVLFNQVELPDDEAEWPLWMEQVHQSTGLTPLAVYLVPRDRAGVRELRLQFLARRWPAGEAHPSGEPTRAPDAAPQDDSVGALRGTLTRLRFAEIKLRALRGAMRQVADPVAGLPAYLDRVVQARQTLLHVGERLNRLPAEHWPPIPTAMLVSAVGHWWHRQRAGWRRAIHAGYGHLGEAVLWPWRQYRHWSGTTPPSALETYAKDERVAMQHSIDWLIDRLIDMHSGLHPTLQERVLQVTSGPARQALVEELARDHAGTALEALFQQHVDGILDDPVLQHNFNMQLLEKVDAVTTVARPLVSIGLFVTGFGLPIGAVATQALGHGLVHAAAQGAVDAATASMLTAVGDQAAAGAAKVGWGALQNLLFNLQATFIESRKAWLQTWLSEKPLGRLQRELIAAAALPDRADWIEVRELADQLASQVRQLQAGGEAPR